jgi:hypothetical protein
VRLVRKELQGKMERRVQEVLMVNRETLVLKARLV